MQRVAVGALIVIGLTNAALAGTVHSVSSSLTSTTLHGGDRELNTLGFTTSSTIFTGANFLHWHSGSLTNNLGTFGWFDPVPRDMSTSGNAVSGNPDRAYGSTPFGGEGGGTGTLAEVFGPFNGYKNMSYIIDGEDNGAWTLDLLFAPGQSLVVDSNTGTVEVAILERGGNSDLRVRGIRSDGSYTDPFMMLRGQTGYAGWTLDTLEISGAQKVHGAGLSLDASWNGIVGLRLEAANGMNGPDLVAVGVGQLIPAPGAVALLMLGGFVGLRRRR